MSAIKKKKFLFVWFSNISNNIIENVSLNFNNACINHQNGKLKYFTVQRNIQNENAAFITMDEIIWILAYFSSISFQFEIISYK